MNNVYSIDILMQKKPQRGKDKSRVTIEIMHKIIATVN